MIKKYWNTDNVLGLVIGVPHLLFSIFDVSVDKITSFFWRYNLKKMGKNSIIQKGAVIRFPGNVEIGNRVNIGRKVIVDTEFDHSFLIIGDDSQVNIGSNIDYSGGIKIGKHVVISSGTRIFTHSHGYHPKASPVRKPLVIEDDVWIGSNSMILENVEYIGKGSMIGGGSVLTKNVEPYSIMGGNPAQLIKLKI